jgi:hypothetical protein
VKVKKEKSIDSEEGEARILNSNKLWRRKGVKEKGKGEMKRNKGAKGRKIFLMMTFTSPWDRIL